MAETTKSSLAKDEPKKPRRRWWQRWWAIVGGVSVVAGLVASGIVIWDQIIPHYHQVFAFTDPSPDNVTPEPCVFTASGRIIPPAGQALIISDRVQGVGNSIDPLLHFGIATIKPNTDQWYAEVQIGISRTSAGTPYTLTAWLVSSDWINYLIQVTPQKEAWWATLQSPPGAEKVASTSITRNGFDNCPNSK